MATLRIQVAGTENLTNLHNLLDEANRKAKELESSLANAFDPQQIRTIQQELSKLTEENRKLTEQVRTLEEQVSKSNKAFNAQKNQGTLGHIEQLRKKYEQLSREIEGMSKEMLNSRAGKAQIKQAQDVRSELDKLEASYQRVGEASSGGRDKRFGFSPIGIGFNVLAASAILKSGYAVMNMLQDSVQVTLDYEQANANLNSVLGQTADQTEKLRVQQRQLGEATAFTATQVAEMQIELSKLGFTQTEVLQSTEGVINFAIATGVDVPRAAATAGAALRSFQLDASEMDRVVSTLGVATTKSALDFSKLEVAIPIVGGVAKQFGATIEETTAQLGVLSDRGITASTAATALRNIYLRSADAGLTFNQALDKLAASQTIVNDALDMFGVRGALQATILALNREETDELTDSISNVNQELQDMADKRMDTVIGKTTLFNSAWQELILTLDDGDSILSTIAKNFLSSITGDLRLFTSAINGVISWREALQGVVADNTDIIDTHLEIRKGVDEIGKSVKGFDGDWSQFNLLDAVDQQLERNAKLTEEINAKKQKELDTIAEMEAALAAKAEERQKKEIKAQEGSIAWLQQEIKLLEEKASKETDEDRIVQYTKDAHELTQQLKEAQEAMKELKEEIEWAALESGLAELGEDSPLAKMWRDAQKEIDKYLIKEEDATRAEEKRLREQAAKEEERFDASLHRDRVRADRQEAQRQRQEKRDAEREDRLEERRRKEKVKHAVDAAKAANDAVFTIMQQNADRDLQREISNMERAYRARMDMANLTESARAQLEEEMQHQRDQLEREAFEKSKRRQIAEAIINGAAAAIQALSKTLLPFPASLIGPASVGVQTAAQVAIIRNTSYADGGFTDDQGIPDPRHPGRKIVGVVHDQEYVVRKEEIARFPEEIHRIETARRQSLRSFADGGFTSSVDFDYLARRSSPNVNVSMEDIYQAMYEGTKRGTEAGAREGTKAGERDKILRTIRDQSAQRNMKE